MVKKKKSHRQPTSSDDADQERVSFLTSSSNLVVTQARVEWTLGVRCIVGPETNLECVQTRQLLKFACQFLSETL